MLLLMQTRVQLDFLAAGTHCWLIPAARIMEKVLWSCDSFFLNFQWHIPWNYFLWYFILFFPSNLASFFPPFFSLSIHCISSNLVAFNKSSLMFSFSKQRFVVVKKTFPCNRKVTHTGRQSCRYPQIQLLLILVTWWAIPGDSLGVMYHWGSLSWQWLYHNGAILLLVLFLIQDMGVTWLT